MTLHGSAPEHTKMLIIDDETAVLDATADYLTAHGYDVDTAEEREEAEALLLNVPYSLVIADMRLTGTHGREGLEVIRIVRDQQPDCRMIVVTGLGSRDLRDESMRSGADAFLTKPVPLSDILTTVQRLLTRSP